MHRKSSKRGHKPSEEYCGHGAYGPRGTFLLKFKTIDTKKKTIEKDLKDAMRKLNKDYSRSYRIETDFSELVPPKPPYIGACIEVTGDYRALSVIHDRISRYEKSVQILYPQVRNHHRY